jgi:ActR/RegA family two-component response regulator
MAGVPLALTNVRWEKEEKKEKKKKKNIDLRAVYLMLHNRGPPPIS